jgi:hypothetical protein
VTPDLFIADRWLRFARGEMLTFEVLLLLEIRAIDYVTIPGIETRKRQIDPKNPPPMLRIDDIGTKRRVELRTASYVFVTNEEDFHAWLVKKREHLVGHYAAAMVHLALLRQP